MTTETYEVALVLSGVPKDIEGTPRLTAQTSTRVDLAVQAYKNEQVESLLMSGGKAGTHFAHADVMAKYACEFPHHVPLGYVRTEDKSLDSVGQLVLARHHIIEPSNVGSVLIVTDQTHLVRVGYIAERVFGPEFKVGFAGNSWPYSRAEIAKEKKSIEFFDRDFGDIEAGDNEAMLERLLTRHGLYKDRPRTDFTE